MNPIRLVTRSLTVVTLLILAGCNSTPTAQPIRSLERSGRVSFLCRDNVSGEGRPLDACPDRGDDGEERHLLALVTQTQRGEVAFVDFTDSKVLDMDPSSPGPTFVPVGADPVDIVTTPGGSATFVAVAQAGREGLFGLPTSCLGAADAAQARRDLTSWPACSLPAAPGRLSIIADPPAADGALRQSCSGGALMRGNGACGADLSTEAALAPIGRKLLAVTLPSLGQVAVIDAQALLERGAGTFEPCPIEAVHIPQTLPSDYRVEGCDPAVVEHPVPTQSFAARPAGLSLRDGRLYLADLAAPVVHVLDVRDPCQLAEEPPLLPVSLEHPGQLVTTSDVTTGPSTTDGRLFAYAVDGQDGSLMVFRLDAGAERTPMVLPGAALRASQRPDRVDFGSPVKSLQMLWHDMPALDGTSELATFSVACDPDPTAAEPGSLYRTSADRSRGARPGKLRGLFTVAALANGQLAFVDIEDLDAPCRRPSAVNPGTEENSLGCSLDPDIAGYIDGPSPTVSDESSCRAVEPHAERSLQFLVSSPDTGVRAPSLRSFPRLSDTDGSLAVGQIGDAVEHPMMLAVGFAGEEPEVKLGTFSYGTSPDADRPLVLDPAVAEEASLLLPQREPRAYSPQELFSLTYEGALLPSRTTGVLSGYELTDPDAGFCGLGVQDVAFSREWGAQLGVASSALDAFAAAHADYVQLTGEFDEKSPYWKDGAGARCEEDSGFDGCKALFGTVKDPTSARDLLISEAWVDHLVLSPRGVSDATAQRRLLDAISCCLPGALSYTIRGGNQWVFLGSSQGSPHRVTAGADNRCVSDCGGRSRWNQGRVLEISSSGCPAGTSCRIGAATSADSACITTRSSGGVDPASDEVSNGCIFNGVTARFAVYRGQLASRRDMRFQWEVIGGFSPLRVSTQSLASGSSVLPQQLVYLPQNDRLVVVDGALGGLGLISLATLQQYPSEPFL
jgi:hypothetical protein